MEYEGIEKEYVDFMKELAKIEEEMQKGIEAFAASDFLVLDTCMEETWWANPLIQEKLLASPAVIAIEE